MAKMSNQTTHKTPILFLIFDRKDVTAEAFKAIREHQPERLFIAADGPRPHKEGEAGRCEQTRKAVLDMIDWECEVNTLFRTENLGCAGAVSSAIDWFFKNVEWGAIIEDDVIVSPDFYRMCEEVMPLYANDDRVMMVTAQCYAPKESYIADEYTFSNSVLIWGWATWRRAWARMDMSMSKWPSTGISDVIKAYGLFEGLMRTYYWSSDHRHIANGDRVNSWYTRWAFSIMSNRGLCLVPRTNLSKNIGCSGVGGAHYESSDIDPYAHLQIEPMKWPLKAPAKVAVDRQMQKFERKDFFRIRMIGLRKKLKKLFS